MCCQESELCPMHLEDRYAQLRGVAASRAHTWVQSLLGRRVRGRAWDPDKALAIARMKVADLARDLKLTERLAVECERCAREAWEGVRPDAHRSTR